MGLEVELQPHLDLTRHIDLALDIAEIAVAERIGDAAELRVIEGVEGFCPDLQLGAFSHLAQRYVLE